ncbi:hypothetical protein GGF32_006572 [Allomyces javanicus]|nr:hypothetical protein GGF32_006572 [Allomyces javanicus]
MSTNSLTTTISESRLADLRARLITAIQSGGPVDANILSGGGLKYAVTVLTSPDATDAPYATAIANKLGLEHVVICYDLPLELIGEEVMPAASSSSSTARGARTTSQSVYGTRGPRGRLANLKEAAVPSAPTLVPITVEDEMEAFTGKAMLQTFQARGGTHGPPQEPLVPTRRQRWAFYLDTSHAGRWLDLIDAVLSLLQCAL